MSEKIKKGILVIVDGIDGSGKGTIVRALAQWAEAKNLKVLDLKDYWKTKHTFPEPEEIKKFDCIVSAEPTFSMVGQAIREEIIRDNRRHYSAFTTAEAFALDREILYRRIIIPALEQGKYIFQERGITTSLIYQPVQKEPLSLQKILNLSGNKLAIKYRPDLLIITQVEPETALKRLAERDKKDDTIFEKLPFLKKLNVRFSAPWFCKIFKKHGTKVVYLKTNKTVYDTMEGAVDIWEKFLVSYKNKVKNAK
jgi:thymidylate kinase